MTQAVQPVSPGPGTDEFRLDGYVALVTGAGRGIGAGIARAYARAGADVVLVARTAGELEDVAGAVRAAGRSASVILADLTDVSRRRIVMATPLHRLSTVADVANTARWLASPAASYITGKIIEIDGGAEAPTFPDDTPDLRPANKH